MKKNVGTLDRAVRVVIGIAIAVTGYLYGSWWGLAGIVPIATAFISFCPLYTIFKLNTSEKK